MLPENVLRVIPGRRRKQSILLARGVVPGKELPVLYACWTTGDELMALAFEHRGDKVGVGCFDVGERPVDDDRHGSGLSCDLRAGPVHGVFGDGSRFRGSGEA